MVAEVAAAIERAEGIAELLAGVGALCRGEVEADVVVAGEVEDRHGGT
jgi:hypothetical protein